jgi:outer membrane lipoprotein LolB
VSSIKRFNALAAVLAVLAGCATAPREPLATAHWQSHRDRVAAIPDWSFSGKLAISTPQGTESARLRWSQQGEDLQMEVSGPIGINQIIFVRENSQLRVFEDRQWRSLTVEEATLEQQLGWPLPLDLLPWWLRGIPAPQPPATDMAVSDGRLQQLHQAGWTLEYPSYQQVDDVVLPGKLLFHRGEVKGKILFKQWQLRQ